MEKKKKNRKKWNKYLIAGLVMTGISLTMGIVGLFWTPYSTTAMSAAEKFAAPSVKHIFGTDNFGRGCFFQSDAGSEHYADDQYPGGPVFRKYRNPVRSCDRIFRRDRGRDHHAAQ